MAVAKTTVEKIQELMHYPEQIRNIGTVAHIDYDPQEAARGITINAANISMIHHYNDKEFLINLIDTPGHIDFSGEVTRAMRAIDCAIVLVDAVEGIMPQTETVLRQSLKEGVKPVLFINKVDRLIKELQLPPEKMQERFIAIIGDVNRIIESLAPKQFKQSWQVNVQNGSVCFGSAKHKWALSIPMMKKKNISLKHIIDAYQGADDSWKQLGRTATLHEAVLDMVIQHGPNPKKAQEYRIPIICKGANRLLIDDAPPGNIVGVVGLKNAGSGETVSEKAVTPFESIKHLFDPVVTIAIEPKNPQDLPKLIDVLKGIAKQDPTIAISINEETGENLFSGLGELHIEIWMYRIQHDKHLEVIQSPPIVVYREAIVKKFGPIEGKSPNRHNKLYVTVEPLDKNIVDAIQSGAIPEGKMKKKKDDVVNA